MNIFKVGKLLILGAAQRLKWRAFVCALVGAFFMFTLACVRASAAPNQAILRQVHGEEKMTDQAQPQKIVTNKSVISTGFRYMRSVAWSPDSKLFAVTQTTGLTASIVVYDAATQKIVKSLEPPKCGPYSGENEAHGGDVSFSPDGRYLAGGIGIITLWDTKTWQPVRDILGPFERGSYAAGPVESIAFSPDSKSLAILYSSVLWPESMRVDGREAIFAVARIRKTDKSISNSRAIMAFDVETTNRVFLVKEEKAIDSVNKISRMFTGGVSYSHDGKYILSADCGGVRHDFLTKDDDPSKKYTRILFFDAKTGMIVNEIQDIHVMNVTSSALSHNGKFIATGTDTGAKRSTRNQFSDKWYSNNNTDPIRIWDVASGKKLQELGPIRGSVRSFAFSPDDRVLVSCQTDISENETIWLWDLASGQLIERVSTPRSGHDFHACALSPDGRIIAMPVADKIYLVNIKPQLQ